MLCGVKEEWAQVQEPANNPAGRATRGSHAIQSTRVRRRLDTAIESSASLPSTQESIQGI